MVLIQINPTNFGCVVSINGSTYYLNRYTVNALNNLDTNNISSEFNFISNKIGERNFISLVKKIKKKYSYVKSFYSLCENNNWKLCSYIPTEISIETINICNAKCPWCYKKEYFNKGKQEIDVSIIKQIKDIASIYGTRLAYSGGEPLLFSNIYESLTYKNKEVYDVLLTNLSIDFDIDKLIKTEVDLIQVTINGPPWKNNEIMGINNSEEVLCRIDYLAENGITFATNTIITDVNIETIEELLEILSEYNKRFGDRYKYTRLVIALPNYTENIFIFRKQLISDFKKKVEKLRRKFPELNYEIPLEHGCNPLMYFEFDNRLICPAGCTQAEINIDGRIRPCNHYPEHVSSNKSVLNDNFINIWHTDPLFDSYRKGVDVSRCSGCEEKDNCIGKCIYMFDINSIHCNKYINRD